MSHFLKMRVALQGICMPAPILYAAFVLRQLKAPQETASTYLTKGCCLLKYDDFVAGPADTDCSSESANATPNNSNTAYWSCHDTFARCSWGEQERGEKCLHWGLTAQFPRKYITANFPVTYAGKGKEHGKVGILILYAVELHIL